MTTIRKIVTSKIDGNSANTSDNNEIRPFGEAAFYLETLNNKDKLVLLMFDGQRTHIKSKVLSAGRLYGSEGDSGDDNGLDTIKLIPDAELYDNDSDQYLIIDPTQGEPGHIHIRAGGTQDDSSADLYLGAELTHVKVSDTNREVTVKTTPAGEAQVPHSWTFDDGGRLLFPSGGAIEPWGMGWIGLTNGDSNTPVSIAYKKNDGEFPVGLSEIFLAGTSTAGNVNIYTQDLDADISHQWIFSENGDTVIPGAVINSTVTKTATPNTGIPTALSDSTWITPLVDGSYGPFTGSTVPIVYTAVVASGVVTYTIVSYPGNIALNTTIDQLSSESLGGAPGETSNIAVSAVNDVIELDLAKTVNKLANGTYSLADGGEGQIMHLVRQDGSIYNEITVRVANARIDGTTYTDIDYFPFNNFGGPLDMATLIFTDDAWQTGSWD